METPKPRNKIDGSWAAKDMTVKMSDIKIVMEIASSHLEPQPRLITYHQ